MDNWLTPSQIPVPALGDYPTLADWMLAYAVRSALMDAALNFLSATPDAEYANPDAYRAALRVYAQSLTQNTFPTRYAPPGWDPIAAADKAADVCFATLDTLPVNAGDPNTVSMLVAWVEGTGQLAGGHAPTPAATGDGKNEATGQSAAPPGGIL